MASVEEEEEEKTGERSRAAPVPGLTVLPELNGIDRIDALCAIQQDVPEGNCVRAPKQKSIW